MPIAFFDLDRTILEKNSGTLWVRSELRDGFISWGQALHASTWIVRYHLGYAADMAEPLRGAIRLLAGTREEDLAERTRRFYEREVRHLVRPGALEVLQQHRDAGHRLVLLTSASVYLSRCVAPDLGIADVLAMRFAVEGGVFTGEAVEPLCYGAGKAALARELAGTLGEDLADCAFYSDSAVDLPMLEAVGAPVAVNPDQKLARTARKRGWKVVDWGRAGRP